MGVVPLPQIDLHPRSSRFRWSNHPSLLVVEVEWNTMKRAPTDKPNLDDVLARDFAELKVGEANLKTSPEASAPETPMDDAAASKSEQTTPALPKVYNQRINAVEDREAFSVKAPKATAIEEAQPTEKPTPTVLKAPSSQPGDDFDVDW